MKFVLVSPAYKHLTLNVNFALVKELLWYASPLVLAGFAGIINETLDRTLIRRILEPSLGEVGALTQVGIYGAVYKLAILITLFTQAFRYAAEPFFFSQDREGNSKKVYADVLKWYTVIVTGLFLVVMLYLDLFKILIRNEAYWEGLSIVPILLFANIFLGWIYNLSVWYKLTHKTIYGAILAVIGALITIGLNVYLIPRMGYAGAAWTTLVSYGTMAVLSYLLGRRFFPVPYELGRIVGYSVLALILWHLSTLFNWSHQWIGILMNTLILFVFGVAIAYFERNDLKRFLKIK
jgi:O-antigen/teichoic acid export membrane protein